jgi:hypothetical protein
MGQLNILGVKRVEALQAMLDDKYKSKIAAVTIPSKAQIADQLDAEFGITKLRTSYKSALQTAEDALKRLNDVTGSSGHINISHSYRGDKETAYSKREDELDAELRKAPVNALTIERDSKKRQLWLCETLEEARAIVDGE